jgi:hypothetical protein
MPMRIWWLAALALAGCGGDSGPALLPSPSHASLFGQVDVTFAGDVASLGDVQAVTVGGIAAWNLRADPTSLTVTLQGAPKPGAADVIVTGSRGSAVRHGLFTYDAPSAGVPLVWAAFGASLTQGTQSGGIDPHTQIYGVAAQTTRAAGVFLALPLFVEGLAPPLLAKDFNPDCSQKPGTGASAQTIASVVADPANMGLFDLRRGRIDYTLAPRDFAIGGSKVSDILDGGRGAPALLEHIVEEPTSDPDDVLGPEETSQIQRLEMLDPDVALSTDLLANDLDGSVTQGDDLHPENITDPAQVMPLLTEMMGRLGKLHGQYFIANMPSLTFVPNVVALRAKWIAAGNDPAVFDAKSKMIDDLTDQYNAMLATAMQPFPNLHLVDFKGEVDQISPTGERVGGELLTVAKFDGLLSLDSLHFSDTGYALYGNVFIDAINTVLKTSIPAIDLTVVHAQDQMAPSVLRAAGLQCVPPPQ